MAIMRIDVSRSAEASGYEAEQQFFAEELERAEQMVREAASLASRKNEEAGRRQSPVPHDDHHHHHHDAIAVLGGRGAGKTSFMLSLKQAIENGDGNQERIRFLRTLDPSRLEDGDIALVMIVANVLELLDGHSPGGKLDWVSDDKVSAALKKLTRGFQLLMQPEVYQKQWSELFKDPQMLGYHLLDQVSSGARLGGAFSDFLKQAAAFLNIDLFVQPIDDVDTHFEQGWPVLETVRRYLGNPFILPVVSGDYPLFRILVRQNQWQQLGALVDTEKAIIDTLREETMRRAQAVNGGVAAHFERPASGEELSLQQYVEQVDGLEEQYLVKVLPPERRITLRNAPARIAEDATKRRLGTSREQADQKSGSLREVELFDSRGRDGRASRPDEEAARKVPLRLALRRFYSDMGYRVVPSALHELLSADAFSPAVVVPPNTRKFLKLTRQLYELSMRKGRSESTTAVLEQTFRWELETAGVTELPDRIRYASTLFAALYGPIAAGSLPLDGLLQAPHGARRSKQVVSRILLACVAERWGVSKRPFIDEGCDLLGPVEFSVAGPLLTLRGESRPDAVAVSGDATSLLCESIWHPAAWNRDSALPLAQVYKKSSKRLILAALPGESSKAKGYRPWRHLLKGELQVFSPGDEDAKWSSVPWAEATQHRSYFSRTDVLPWLLGFESRADPRALLLFSLFSVAVSNDVESRTYLSGHKGLFRLARIGQQRGGEDVEREIREIFEIPELRTTGSETDLEQSADDTDNGVSRSLSDEDVGKLGKLVRNWRDLVALVTTEAARPSDAATDDTPPHHVPRPQDIPRLSHLIETTIRGVGPGRGLTVAEVIELWVAGLLQASWIFEAASFPVVPISRRQGVQSDTRYLRENLRALLDDRAASASLSAWPTYTLSLATHPLMLGALGPELRRLVLAAWKKVFGLAADNWPVNDLTSRGLDNKAYREAVEGFWAGCEYLIGTQQHRANRTRVARLDVYDVLSMLPLAPSAAQSKAGEAGVDAVDRWRTEKVLERFFREAGAAPGRQASQVAGAKVDVPTSPRGQGEVATWLGVVLAKLSRNEFKPLWEWYADADDTNLLQQAIERLRSEDLQAGSRLTRLRAALALHFLEKLKEGRLDDALADIDKFDGRDPSRLTSSTREAENACKRLAIDLSFLES